MVAQVKWLEWDTGGGVGRCPTPAEVVRLSPTMARLEPMTPPELTAQAVLFCLPTQASVVLADFGAYHKHGHFDFEELPGFNAAFGFLAYVGLVLSATQLRKLLKRDEDYYD